MTDDRPTLDALLKDALPPHRAPAQLHEWARAMAASELTESRGAAVEEQPIIAMPRSGRIRALYVAGLVAAVLVGYAGQDAMTRVTTVSVAPPALVAQLVDNHVESLMSGRLMDVRSTDQHTVKPWFAGKVDFAPRVVQLDTLGYPLLGARLAYVQGRPASVLVYGLRKHVINLYTWRELGGEGASASAPAVRAGYSLLHWSDGGLAYWAIADVSATDLAGFQAAYMRR